MYAAYNKKVGIWQLQDDYSCTGTSPWSQDSVSFLHEDGRTDGLFSSMSKRAFAFLTHSPQFNSLLEISLESFILSALVGNIF